jgi:hypothetical protein
MNISRKLITLGLAFSLLGSTCAFARPTPHFGNGHLSYKKNAVENHVPTTKASGATGCVGSPSPNKAKDDWPNNMLLGWRPESEAATDNKLNGIGGASEGFLVWLVADWSHRC